MKFVPNKEHSRTALIFLFSFEENCCGIIPITWRSLWWISSIAKKRVNDGFSVSKLEISMLQTRNTENQKVDVKLQALLDENDSQTQKQLAEQLSVSQQAVFNRLREMGKIQRVGRWVPHELNERQMQKRKNTCEILLERYRRKSFLHRIVTGDEKWIFF